MMRPKRSTRAVATGATLAALVGGWLGIASSSAHAAPVKAAHSNTLMHTAPQADGTPNVLMHT